MVQFLRFLIFDKKLKREIWRAQKRRDEEIVAILGSRENLNDTSILSV